LRLLLLVIPAEAGIHLDFLCSSFQRKLESSSLLAACSFLSAELSLALRASESLSTCKASAQLRCAGYFLALPQKVTKKV
jgi:hypothetical protein